MQPEPEIVTFVPVVQNKWCGALGAGDVATDGGEDVVGASDGAGHGAADGNAKYPTAGRVLCQPKPGRLRPTS